MQPETRHSTYDPSLGATFVAETLCRFELWAATYRNIELHLLEPDRRVLLKRDEDGYFRAVVDNVSPQTRYIFRLEDGTELPDPASRFQPMGVHGPSAVVENSF